MTRNTKLYILKDGDKEYTFRDLSILELQYLSNIKNDVVRSEEAARFALIDKNQEIPWQILINIGQKVFDYSNKCIESDDSFELIVREYRDKIKGDFSLECIKKIVQFFPGQSITDLLNLTYKDLIELVCFCETVSGEELFNVDVKNNKKKGMNLINPSSLPDGGKSIQDQIRRLNENM